MGFEGEINPIIDVSVVDQAFNRTLYLMVFGGHENFDVVDHFAR